MSRKYAVMTGPKRGGRKEVVPIAPKEILIAIDGAHTLEQMAQELQVAIARLQDLGIYGAENLRIRLEPRDRDGQLATSPDLKTMGPANNPTGIIRIPEPAEQPIYRPGPYEPLPPARAPKPAPALDGQPEGHPAPIYDRRP